MSGEEGQAAAAAAPEGGAPEVESRAKEMGWIPQEQFRGKAEDFIPADEYVRRGETMLPILRANNRRLESELSSTKAALQQTQKLVQDSQAAIEDLKEFQGSIALERVRAKKTEVLSGIREARESGNVDKESELTDELSNINTALKEAEKPKAEKQKEAEAETDPNTFEPTPDFVAFAKANPWFGKDGRRSAMAVEIAKEMRGEDSELVGKPFLDEVARRVNEFFDEPPVRASKVSGSSSKGSGTGGAKSFDRMPSDAQAACDRLSGRMVGEGRGKFKTAQDWRNHYAKSYFSQE